MRERPLTRRTFLAASGAAVLALVGCGGGGSGGGGGGAPGNGVVIFALSGRGRRVSQAAKKHNANLRFRTSALANLGQAHPGDTSQVVRLFVSQAEFARLFPGSGGVADLRHL